MARNSLLQQRPANRPPRMFTQPVQALDRVDRPEDSTLPLYELTMVPNDLLALERNPYANATYPAKFTASGQSFENVKVRFRGAWARSWPKKPFKISFDHDHLFEGKRCLNLNSGWRDPAFVREPLAYHVYAACHVPAPKARMVRLHINHQFGGLYIEVEQPDKAFLKRHNLNGASIYKAVSRWNQADERDFGNERIFSTHYKKESQKSEGFGELQRFCNDLAHTTDLLDFFNRNVDLDKYIDYLAASVLVQQWDGYNKNHFLVYDGQGSKKWFVVPWDLDRTFGDLWNGSFQESELPIGLGTRGSPGITGWNRLQDRFFSQPDLRARFIRRLAELIEKEFTTEKLFPVLDQFESEIRTTADLDRQRWPSPTPDLHSGIAEVKRYIERRRAYLLAAVERLDRN